MIRALKRVTIKLYKAKDKEEECKYCVFVDIFTHTCLADKVFKCKPGMNWQLDEIEGK